jgi:hypothetical protein
MQKMSFLKKFKMIALFLLIISSQLAEAQSLPPGHPFPPPSGPLNIINAINSIRASIDSIVNLVATYIFQTPPNIGRELVTNNTLSTTPETVKQTVSTLTQQDIQNTLSPNTENPNLNLLTLSTVRASDTVLPTLTLFGVPSPFLTNNFQQNLQTALVQGNANFNFQSLVTPLVYNSKEMQNYALNFIRFISGWGTPISNVNLGSYPESQLSLKQKIEIQNSGEYQSFSVARRQLVAQQSSALSVLYNIYSRRMPIPTINAVDTGLNVANPSAAQIEDYNATWRTSSPTWYTQMSTASPANIQREILFVLAEMQLELHRMHLENEHMLALTAITQLANLQTGKQMLTVQEKRVQEVISDQAKANAEQGLTGQPGTAGPKPAQQTQAQNLQQAAQQANQQTPPQQPK